jgi:hypothetical protein
MKEGVIEVLPKIGISIISLFFISIIMFVIQNNMKKILTENQLKDKISIERLGENPLLEENKVIANLAIDIASKTLSYAKAVRYEDDYTVVDVVVANKLCHVSFKIGGDMLLADKITCDGGGYFNNRNK